MSISWSPSEINIFFDVEDCCKNGLHLVSPQHFDHCDDEYRTFMDQISSGLILVTDIILKVVLKLAYGGAWIAGTALILTKYRDDPERMIQLFQQIVLPCGVLLKYIFEGSIICILQVIELHGLQTLWQNFESGLLKKLLENVLITEDLYKLANGDEIIMEVFLEETRAAR